MKSLFFIFFIFCLTSLNSIAQENTSTDILNDSNKQTVNNNAKLTSLKNDAINLKQNDALNMVQDNSTINGKQTVNSNAKSTPIKDDTIILKQNDASNMVQDNKINAVQNNLNMSMNTNNIQELWHGKIYSSTYKAGVCIEANGELKGVLKLKTAKGDIDTYHFYGHFQNNKIYAKHGSGHMFNGAFLSDKNVGGKIALKNGYTLSIKGKRTKNVQLTDNCAPLTDF